VLRDRDIDGFKCAMVIQDCKMGKQVQGEFGGRDKFSIGR
jgi:hypothetical protein